MNNDTQKNLIKIVQRDKQSLAAAYPKWFRFAEIFGLIIFFFCAFILLSKVSIYAVPFWYLLIPALVLSWLSSDIVGGIIHWAGDTWGSPDIPILGAALIRPFREHHIDPKAMTKHDFIETNAACALVALPILVICLFLSLGIEHKIQTFIMFFIFFLTFFIFLTNQIHKWSHTENVGVFIYTLQKLRLILNPVNHDIHHLQTFDKYYCITSGFMNKFFYKVDFFKRAERFITKLTGALPRRDDIGENAARSTLYKFSSKEFID